MGEVVRSKEIEEALAWVAEKTRPATERARGEPKGGVATSTKPGTPAAGRGEEAAAAAPSRRERRPFPSDMWRASFPRT